MSVRILPYGEAAVLVETGDPLALRAALAGRDGVLELVPGAQTLLVRFDPAVTSGDTLLASGQLPGRVGGSSRPPDHPGDHSRVELDVRYDGADLAAVADESGLSVAEVVRLHSGAEYTVAFCGFSPGFAYLTGLDPALHLPRLPSPRTSVPAGSVAIAGGFTGVYPRSSPGGWRLLGRTDAPLWDTARPNPALLEPGTRVRFRPC